MGVRQDHDKLPDDDDERDEQLLAELKGVLAQVDPVPGHVTAAARAALGWRTLDEDLADLLYDSSEELEPVGVRGEDQPRTLSFRGPSLGLDVEISGKRGRSHLTGTGAASGPGADRRPPRHRGARARSRRTRPFRRRGGARGDREPQLSIERGPALSSTADAVAAHLTPAPPASRDHGAALAAEAYRVVVVEPQRARALAMEALRLAGKPADPATTSAAHRALGMAALELDDASTAVGPTSSGGSSRAARGRAARGRSTDEPGPRPARQWRDGRALRQSDRALRIEGVAEPGPLQLQRAMILERLGRFSESLEDYRLALGELPAQRRPQRRGAGAL
jgi:hypothetical protein